MSRIANVVSASPSTGMVGVAVLFTLCKGDNNEVTEEYRDTGSTESSPGKPFDVLSLLKAPSNLANLISSAVKNRSGEGEEELEGTEDEAVFNHTLPSDSKNDTQEATSNSSSTPASSSPLTTFLAAFASSLPSSASSDPNADDEDGVQFSPASPAQVSQTQKSEA